MPTKHKPSPQREFVPWLTVARVVLSKTTNTESSYPEVSSSPPLESRLNLIRQGTVKVLRHPTLALHQPIDKARFGPASDSGYNEDSASRRRRVSSYASPARNTKVWS